MTLITQRHFQNKSAGAHKKILIHLEGLKNDTISKQKWKSNCNN